MGRLALAVSAGLLAISAQNTAAASKSPQPSAVQAARALRAPSPVVADHGEFEGYEFWEEHDDLLKRAWQELGPGNPELYTYGPAFEQRYVRPELLQAALAARAGRGESEARSLFTEIVPGVFMSERLLTKQFMEDMLSELQHIEGSGIPRRRPNGMNRYGVILDQVGMESALDGFIDAYIRPLAGMLFPELVGAEDAEEHYAFTVQYEATGDVELAKHGDASVVTLNLCLGREGWTGGALRFFASGGSGMYALPRGNESAGDGDVVFTPGMVLMHRGQHKHQALPLTSGTRTNLVLWLMGRHGVVRVAPYSANEQLSPAQRWRQELGAGSAAGAPAPPPFMGL